MPRKNFTKQLEQLNDQMITMGCMIENTISMAIKALAEQNVELAEEVIASDYEIDTQERNIEQMCYKLLLMQQPMRSAYRVRDNENDHGYGADRGSRRGHFGAYDPNGRKTLSAGDYRHRADGNRGDQDGDKQCGCLCQP